MLLAKSGRVFRVLYKRVLMLHSAEVTDKLAWAELCQNGLCMWDLYNHSELNVGSQLALLFIICIASFHSSDRVFVTVDLCIAILACWVRQFQQPFQGFLKIVEPARSVPSSES